MLLLGVPGEVLAPLAARWRELGGPGAEVVSLADGYLGYLDAPDQPTTAERHPERSYYGPALTPALERGLELVVGAVREAQKPPINPK